MSDPAPPPDDAPPSPLWSVIHDPATPAALGAALADASVALDVLVDDDATPEDLAAVDRARARLATTARSVLGALAAGASITGDRVGAVGLVLAELALRPDAVSDPAPPADDAPPSPLYAVAPETVRITVMWTGDPVELDDALRVLGFGLGPGLARQIVDGALGAEGELDEECHGHLTVVRHDRGGTER